MSSVTSSGVTGSSQQSSRMALLVKLFQTSGKSAQDSKKDPAHAAASPPPPPPPPPAQHNSAAGLASMFQALQSQDTGSVSDLLSRLLQAVDSDGDGTISADELQAVTELSSGAPQNASPPPLPASLLQPDDADGRPFLTQDAVTASPGGSFARVDGDSAGQLPQSELDEFEANLTKRADPAQSGPADLALDTTRSTKPAITAYEALFQALQLGFAQATAVSGTTGSRRYTDMLKSLANAG